MSNYRPTYRAEARVERATEKWDTLTREEQLKLMNQCGGLMDIQNFGELSLAELLCALGEKGYLAEWADLHMEEIELRKRQIRARHDLEAAIDGELTRRRDALRYGRSKNGAGR